MKKVLAFMLALMMAMPVTGCGSSTPAPQPTEQAPTSAPTRELPEAESEEAEETEAWEIQMETEEEIEAPGGTIEEAATQVETTVSVREPQNDRSEFIFPDSDTEYLRDEDMAGVSASDLRIGRNEIFARHGRIFNDKKLRAYFEGCSWYEGTIDGDKFDKQTDSLLNSVEKRNVKTIQYAEMLAKKGIEIREETCFDATWELIQRYEMSDMVKDDTSELAFEYDPETVFKMGSYYQMPVTISRIAKLDKKMKKGDKVKFVIDELTGERITLTMGSDGIIRGSNGMELELKSDMVLYYAFGSDDALYIPIAEGTLRVNTKAPVGYFGEPEATIDNLGAAYTSWYNGVSFDSQGYVTGLLFYGD